MKKQISYALVIFMLLTFFSCKKDKDPKPEVPDINIIDISGDSNWDYFVFGQKDYYFIKANGSKPEAVLYHSQDAGYDYSIFFTADGFLDKVVVEDYVVSFKNPDGNKIDMGIIYPNGEVEILREVETNFDWDNYQLKSINSTQAWSDIVRWTGRIVAGVPCALTVVATVSTGGVATPLAAWTCGSYLLQLSADIMENEYEIHNNYTEYVNIYGTFSTISSCATVINGVDCVTGLASNSMSDWADDLREIEENREDDVHLVDAALEYGYGDVQITLTWDNIADIDLHVFDPKGEEIYWDDKYSSTGGILDVDDINGFGPENVYWSEFEAPSGNYEVFVHMYDWEESDYIYATGNEYYPNESNYTVLVNAFGTIKKYTGHISYDEVIHIVDFNEKGLKSGNLKNNSIVTIKKGKK